MGSSQLLVPAPACCFLPLGGEQPLPDSWGWVGLLAQRQGRLDRICGLGQVPIGTGILSLS